MSSLKEKANVIMLSTNTLSNIALEYGENNQLLYNKNRFHSVDGIRQNLYICSTEEIKEGDYVINESNSLYKVGKFNNKFNFDVHSVQELDIDNSKFTFLGTQYTQYCKKVIASTDTSLGLPTVSKSFIEAYITAYNKGVIITDVMVEYEEIHYCIGCSKLGGGVRHCAHPEECGNVIDEKILKLRGNEIIITRVKESWNRSEVETLLGDYGIDVVYAITHKKPVPFYPDWLNSHI